MTPQAVAVGNEQIGKDEEEQLQMRSVKIFFTFALWLINNSLHSSPLGIRGHRVIRRRGRK